ncbi:MAG: hypothetical protein HYY20_10735, partial [Candidatus Tectomicrobia bacterium]|nr:hypothetical protein [Candidatus Tectomicrobia bacterium]
FLREYLDRSLREVDELKEYTQLPVLGAIPTLNLGKTGQGRNDGVPHRSWSFRASPGWLSKLRKSKA